MFRSFVLLCCSVVFALSAVVAQDEAPAVKIKATPEILALLEGSLQSLSQEEPDPRASGLFRLLGFAVNLENKAPAQKIVDTLLEIAPAIEPEELRNRLYTGVAATFCDMEKYPEAIEILNRVAAAARSEAQLDIAARILVRHEQDKTAPPFDVSGLLRQAIAGAVESNNAILESLSGTFLGHALALQGKSAESAAAFAEAMKVAPKIDNIEERGQIVAMILQRQVEHGQFATATRMLQTVAEAIKPICTTALIAAFLDHEKYNEAEALIKTLPSGETRNHLLGNFVLASIKTVTDVKVGELSALISSDEMRERFLQIVTAQLQKIGRSDVAAAVGKRLKEPAVSEMSLFIGKVEALLEDKKFVEALQFVDATEDHEAIRQHLKRQILVMQYRETYDETVAGQIESVFTRNEKAAIAELREEAKRATETADIAERIDLLYAVFQEQSQFFDFVGARQTIKLVAEQLDKVTEPVQVVSNRVLLARLQIELRDKAGAKANLEKLMQTLSAVNSLNDLKGLVTPPNDGSAISESAIQNQLFQVYVIMASLFSQADAPAESMAALAKAKELAQVESVAAVKAEKLLALMHLLAESQHHKPQ